MKNFLVTKKFDNLGRVVIPKDMRRHYGFESSCMVQLVPQENGVLIVSIRTEENSHGKDNYIQKI